METNNDFNPTYLNRRIQDLEQLQSSEGEELLEVSISIGHRLKGHGDAFGFPEISSLGRQIEEAALSKEMSKLSELIKKFEAEIMRYRSH